MNKHSVLVRTELAKSIARFAANEFSYGNVDVALDSATVAASISPNLDEAVKILRAIESTRHLANQEQTRSHDETPAI